MNPLLIAYFFYHFNLPERSVLQGTSSIHTGSSPGSLVIEQQISRVRSFPAGSQRVPLLELELTASCEADVEIESIELLHQGLGSTQDISAVYIIDGVKRLTAARQVQRNGTATVHFRDFSLQACATRTLTVAADFSDTAAVTGEHWFAIRSADAVSATATVRIEKAKVSASTPKPYTAGGTSVGTISVSYPSLNRRVRYGENQVIGRISLSADTVSDHIIQAITLTNNGSATDDDIQNIYLQTGASEQVTTVASSLDGDAVRLQFTPPLRLQKNQQRLFNIRADVHASRSRTLQIVIEEPSDIESSPVRGR